MKPFLAALTFAVLTAIVANYVLLGNFARPVASAFATEGARVGDPGSNLTGY
ncbi:hypothetical protein SAMN04488003_104162 [Loktanella fryxellensis]|uniref:Uncharacterized protein n=1 Tax=Loktanella fryxellensis TaxID=245187 RepID=A0A1H8B4N4_9RHOB|nr:hypothetical protein [Loktanella fryxellensis]SEM77842.1 hypothetical protein SAMN04488003_104162 [Loktanella fryxellensis]